MPFDFVFDADWKRIANTSQLARLASMHALQRCGAEALQQVLNNFKRGGRPKKWAPLSPSYRKRKRSGKVIKGRQLSSTRSGKADNVLTGALLIAAVAKPKTKIGPDYIEFTPSATVFRGSKPVGQYADFVNKVREFYNVPTAEHQKVATEYEIGFMNVVNGVPDPVGRHLA